MSLYNKLYNWQKVIFDKYKERQSFGIFLDMGLGKTPISLAFAEYHQCNKLIIITLKSKTLESENDEGSFRYWINQMNLKYSIIDKQQKERHYNNNCCLIINYESLFSRKQIVSKKQKNIDLSEILKDFVNHLTKDDKVCIIIDESHNMKNDSSKKTKAILQLKKQVTLKMSKLYSYLLSGTPFTTGYIDLYTQLTFIGCQISKGYFYDNFCIRGNLPGLLGWQQPIVSYKNVNELLRLFGKYSISLLTEDVIDLPKQVFKYIQIPQSESFKLYTYKKYNGKVLYKKLLERGIDRPEFNVNKLVVNLFHQNIDYPNYDYLAETIGQHTLRARELSIGFQGNAEKSTWYDKSRLLKLEEFLENNRDNYLLFYNFTPELFEIYDICEKLNYNIDIYSGEIKNLYFYNKYKNQSPEKQFNNKNNIIIANFASGSTGLNWQAYNKCIIFSLPVYKDYSQGIKRIHRIGQKETVFYYVFYQQNWLDKRMLEALEKKTDYNTQMFKYDLEEVQKENEKTRNNFTR